jgi:hypothetical protein
METLAKLFGGTARIKIMRLFLLNMYQSFSVEDVSTRSRVLRAGARRELSALLAMGFIKHRLITKEGARGAKKKVSVYTLNQGFSYLEPIKDLLVDPNILLQDDLLQRFKPIGKIKLMVVAGVFIGDEKSRADIMIVGDKLKKNMIQQVVKGLESEVGKELDYVVFDTEEFVYRLSMYDKLVSDILDFPHEKLLDLGQLSTHPSHK